MPTIVKGWKAQIYWDPDRTGTYSQIGEAESVSMDIDASLDEYLAVGSKDVYAIVEGPVVLTGSLSRAWIDTQMLALIYGTGADRLQGGFDIYAYRAVAGEEVYIWAYDCKIESLSFDIPADGFLKEDVDFRATYWVYGTTP